MIATLVCGILAIGLIFIPAAKIFWKITKFVFIIGLVMFIVSSIVK